MEEKGREEEGKKRREGMKRGERSTLPLSYADDCPTNTKIGHFHMRSSKGFFSANQLAWN